ncbi:MAG: cysteine desulfurase family protein [Microbacterium sp.]|uniref:cysteine desulfurase family protein n=1 Tax=Microbacterium sp. TaxID=51671 RepID=UPI0039E3F9A2
MTLLYLDNAATTAVRPEVLEAMTPFLTRWFGNPSSHHTVGEAAAGALADARARVARVLGMRASDIVFTSGGTEANNLAIKGIAIAAQQSRSSRPLSLSKGSLVTTAIEHESVLASADYLARVHGFDVVHAPVDGHGRLDPRTVVDALRDDTVLVAFGYANNEVGTVQDAAAVAAVARERGIPVHLDAVQAAGWLPLSGLGADAISLAGHKLGAPKGTGVLAVRGRIPLEPLLHGGGQERGRRSGTEDVAGAVGFATALELAEAERAESAERVGALVRGFIARVLDAVPGARLTGDPVHRLPGTASFTFAGTSGEVILLELERRGIVSSSGSACAAGSDEPSHVLVALGVAAEVAQTAVRFTFPHELDQPLGPVADAVAASVAAVGSSGR